jgi:glycosyltransferase involved in cell wall biosynthesis
MLINITIPVLNEERCLRPNILRLKQFMDGMSFDFEIVIADNGSIDNTEKIGCGLAAGYPSIRYLRLNEKGRGRALKEAWRNSEADILSYMDVDLSTELEAFPALIEAISSGNYEIAAGSRLLHPEWTRRGWKREYISRCYNRLIKWSLGTRFSDAQCGFKAISRACAGHLLGLIKDDHWFFDTELLVLAERLDYRIYDLPVRWEDDPDSRVKIIRTAIEDIRGLIRLRRGVAERIIGL